MRKTKTDYVTPAKAGGPERKAGFPLEFIPHTMRGGNDKYGYIVVIVLSIMSKEV